MRAHARHEADYPLSFRFDETEAVLVCDRVKVPWERVFLHNNGAMSRRIYIETPANCYQNQQSNVRFWAKMGLIVGLASRVCQANGIDKIPAVRETLGRLAALEATIGGLVNGQIEAWEQWPEGYATPNRRIMYATLNWCQEHHTEIIDSVAHLAGGSAAADAGQHRSSSPTPSCGSLRALVVDAGDRCASTASSSTSSPGTWSAPNSPADTCSTSDSMPAIRSSCATRATARRLGRDSMPRWTDCCNGSLFRAEVFPPDVFRAIGHLPANSRRYCDDLPLSIADVWRTVTLFDLLDRQSCTGGGA